MAISTRWSRSPVTRPDQSPSIIMRPSSSRPSSAKKEIAASSDSTTMPTLSIRCSATVAILADRKNHRSQVGRSRAPRSAPAEGRRDVLHDALDDVRVVLDAELARHGEQERVGGGNRFVLGELGDEHVRLCGVRATEDRARALLDVADVVVVAPAAAEVATVEVVDEREDAAADRDTRLALVPRLLPCVAKRLNVPRLDDVERIAARVVEDQRRAHQVHPEPGCPGGGLRRGGAPPDPLAQAR